MKTKTELIFEVMSLEAALALKNSQCERAERAAAGAEAALKKAEAQLAAAQCPNVVCSKEGTQYCALAESSVAKLEAQLAAARKDSERLDYLWDNADDIFSHDGRVLIWLSSQNIRDAIDAARKANK